MIIGLTGYARSGKDTVADRLVHCFDFRKRTIAKPLKDLCKSLFDWSDEHVYGEWKEQVDSRLGASPREIMQFIGTELFRKRLGERFPKIGDNLWVQQLERDHTFCHLEHSLVIPDVRFPNEARWIRNMGGFIVHVDNPRVERGDSHESETSHKHVPTDYTLYNYADIDYLYQQIQLMMSRLMELEAKSSLEVKA